jgi:cobalt-zinc-cadmium efflux system outer membrane protein
MDTAQADDDSPKSLTLEQVVSEVLERNPELAFYQAEVRAARGDLRTAGTFSNPEASFDFGRKREREEGLSGEGRVWSVSVNQSFEFPGRIALRKAIAGRKLAIAETGLKQFRAALSARGRTLGYRLLAAQERANAAQQVASRGQELISVLVQRDPGGVAPLLETKIIEASVIKLRRVATEAMSEAQAALFELNLLRGDPLVTPLVIEHTDISLPVVPSLEELVEMARENNLELQMQKAELESQGFQVALSRNERWPSVSVAPFYSEESALSDERTFGLGVTVPLPLWNRNTGNVETANARKEQAQTSLLLTQRRVERELREKAFAYDLQVQEIARWRPDTVTELRDAAELGDRHYRLGAIPVSTYLELQEQYLEALEAILDTKVSALENVHGLEVLTGATIVTASTTVETPKLPRKRRE